MQCIATLATKRNIKINANDKKLEATNKPRRLCFGRFIIYYVRKISQTKIQKYKIRTCTPNS